MRLLHLHSGNLYGGIETMLVTTARSPTEPVRVSFALCFDGRLRRELLAAGADCTMLGEARFSRPASVRRARLALRRLLHAERPDVVALHGPWAQGLFGGTLHRARVPFVLFVHGRLDGWVQRIGQRWRPVGMICNSAFTRELLPPIYKDIPAAVVHCPVILPRQPSADIRLAVRQELRTSLNDVVVLQASRFETWKGHATHLRALAALREVPGWTLWLVGGAQRRVEERYLAELKALASSLGIVNRVRFAGEQLDASRFMAAADIYCQPNTDPEPFGIVFVEALAAGLPVVASDLGGVREIVDASTGMLVRSGDEHAVADALSRLIRSDALRRELSSAGPARAARLCDVRRQLAVTHDFIAGTVAAA